MKTYNGVAAAFSAFAIWGLLPAYWKLLLEVPAFEILCHRMLWSMVITVGLVLAAGRAGELKKIFSNRKELCLITSTSVLLSANWLLYIWAVNTGYILEASLGYFINPLFNVLLGMFFFGERMRPLQWAALSLAFIGVLYLTVYYGKFPWIGLVLAVSFSLYGLLHKKTTLNALDGLCLETSMLCVPAAAVLVYFHFSANGIFLKSDLSKDLLLIGAGLVTTVPLLLFGYAAHLVRLSTLGLLQYLAPTLSLLLGVFIYHEEFPPHRITGFCIIWTALAVYLLESLAERLRAKKRVLSSQHLS